MDSQLIIYVWDITFLWKYCNTVLAIGKVPPLIGKKMVILNVWVSEFDFLLIEAPLPRCCKKSKITKQLVATGHEYVSLQPSFCCTSR